MCRDAFDGPCRICGPSKQSSLPRFQPTPRQDLLCIEVLQHTCAATVYLGKKKQQPQASKLAAPHSARSHKKKNKHEKNDINSNNSVTATKTTAATTLVTATIVRVVTAAATSPPTPTATARATTPPAALLPPAQGHGRNTRKAR